MVLVMWQIRKCISKLKDLYIEMNYLYLQGNNGSAQRSRSMFPMLRQSNKSGRGGTPSLPPPCWPDYRKDEIFVVEDYADIDTYARDVSNDLVNIHMIVSKLNCQYHMHLNCRFGRLENIFGC